MSKITIPIDSVKTTGALFALYYDSLGLRSDVNKSTNETQAIAEGVFKMTITELDSILVEGGEVEGYLMAVRAPKVLLNEDVPVSLTNSVKWDGTAKTFNDWLVPGAEIWEKDDNTEILFYTNPFAGNESKYLKGSEIKTILIDTGATNVLTIEEAEALTASGWTKL